MGTKSLGSKYIIGEWGQRSRALLISIEHRFYGESIPGGSLSLKNLRYLTSEQALADYAVLIQAVRAQYGAGPESKVVTFGGSYSGSLSAWMRQKYPNVVHAALASSAPVLAQLDYPEYLQVVTDSVGPSCALRLRSAFATVAEMMKTGAGKFQLERDFSACTHMQGDKDEVTFIESLTDNIAGVVQYSGDFNSVGRLYNITRMCRIIESGTNAYSAFVAFARDRMDFEKRNCTDSSYSEMLLQLSDIDPSSPTAASRSWTWQTCVEYGYYQTGTAKTPFSTRIDLKFFTDMCQDVFGVGSETTSRAIGFTNLWYGARNIGSSRIVLTNGSVDPWHALGLTETAHPLMPVFYIKGTAHCADLYASNPNELPELTAARAKSWQYITSWLSEQ